MQPAAATVGKGRGRAAGRRGGDRVEAAVTVVERRSGWRSIDLGELWRQRELLYFLVWRDVKVRYKQTVLGGAWAIIQPLLTMVVFSLVFGRFARIPSQGHAYPIFLYAGLLPWTLFSGSVNRAALSLVNQTHLLTKIYFPRLFVPTAAAGACLVDFALSWSVYAGLMLWYRQPPGPGLLALPALVLLTVVTALGVGYLLASLTVLYRDLRFVVAFMMQLWLFLSPVIYPPTLGRESHPWFRTLLTLNPLTGIIGGFRSALLGRPPELPSLLSAIVIGVAVFAFGLYLFRRTERRFADVA